MSTESEQSAGQGYPPTWQLREHGIDVSLSMDTSVWWSGDLFSAMRTTLGADRSREHLEAHNRQETVTNCHLRAEDVVGWATMGGARALGLDSVPGSIEPGKEICRSDRADQDRGVSGYGPDPESVRTCRVPGSARRRPHGAGERAGGEAQPPASPPAWGRPGTLSGRPSST